MKPAYRNKPAGLETRLSMALAAMLVIIGTGVFLRQYQINPAVIALRPETHSHAQQTESEPPMLIDVSDSAIVPFSAAERFSPETLYEKINGRADLYLSSGFVSLETQRFATKAASGSWVEVFVYDMATPENAFSVFSMQRRADARPDDSAANAYRTENALFLAQGKFYLEFIGTDASPELHDVMGLLAGKFSREVGGDATADAPGSDLFPPKGLQAGSLQLITANAFGIEQLDRVYTCQYLQDGAALTAFISRRADEPEAATLADSYRQTLLSYGATAIDTDVSVNGAFAVQFFDTYEIVFARGHYLAGVHEADSLEAALALAERLAAYLGRLEK